MRKSLYKTITIDSTVLDKTEKDFVLKYYILESDVRIPDGDIIVSSFGIRIEKSYCDLPDICTESAQAKDVMFSALEAVKLLDDLARNKVTPISLSEIIEDMMGGNLSAVGEISYAVGT